MQFKGISSFNQLPSPIYGGDYYYQMGSVNHIRYGGNPFESSSMVGGIPGYLPLYGLLCAGFCNVFNFDTLHGMLYFSIVIFVVACIVWFCLFRTLFKDKWIALIGVLLANGINYYPILKYTPFTQKIMLPLFILFLYLAIKEKTMIYYALLGVIYGLLALSHTICFIGATFLILTFIIYELYKKYEINKSYGITQYMKNIVKSWGIFWIISIPITLLYWYKPLFVYHLHQTNKMLLWNVGTDWGNLKEQMRFLFDSIYTYLLNFNSSYSSILTILAWIGIYGYYNSKSDDLKNFLTPFAIGSIFATFCYFITEPLMNMHFVPNYMSSFYLSTLVILYELYGLNYLSDKLNLKNISDLKNTLIFGSIVLILLTNSVYGFNKYVDEDQWANAGKHPMSDNYVSLQKYLLKNSNINDVILSTKELGFAVNSISGRKLVVNRWAQQNDPYLDLSQRDVDASIILYGNDTKEKLNLIKKYNIKYIYWDYYWINSEYTFDRNGRLTNIYDPSIAFNKPTYKSQLDKYGVKYMAMDWWVDPSMHTVPKMNLLLISPQNYHTYINPWNPDLNQYLEEVWSYSKNGQKIAVLYKVKVYDNE